MRKKSQWFCFFLIALSALTLEAVSPVSAAADLVSKPGEYYRCKGDLGQLTVTLKERFNSSVNVVAEGSGISFNGRTK